jgi:hypothetical protein
MAPIPNLYFLAILGLGSMISLILLIRVLILGMKLKKYKGADKKEQEVNYWSWIIFYSIALIGFVSLLLRVVFERMIPLQ